MLGPTFFGNTYQFMNSLPNLVYYGFLAGSLFPSLLMRLSSGISTRETDGRPSGSRAVSSA